MKNNSYCVYIHTSPSGKKYVGITGKEPEERWGLNGSNYILDRCFWRAIQKYGWENIKHEIVATGLSKDAACKMEVDLIEKLKTNCSKYQNPIFGYNMTAGGDGTFGYRFSDSQRKHLSDIRKGKPNNHLIGNKINVGRKHSNETKHKISESLKGSKNHKARAVCCTTTGKVYSTTRDAAKDIGVSCTAIIMCCKGKIKSCGKMSDGTKLFWEYIS